MADLIIPDPARSEVRNPLGKQLIYLDLNARNILTGKRKLDEYNPFLKIVKKSRVTIVPYLFKCKDDMICKIRLILKKKRGKAKKRTINTMVSPNKLKKGGI